MNRAARAGLMGLFSAVSTLPPLGRLPIKPVAAVGAGLGASAVYIGLRTSKHRAEDAEEQQSPIPARAQAASVVAGAVAASTGLSLSVGVDRWSERGIRALGSEHPRWWMAAAGGVLGGVLEWFDAGAEQRKDSPETP